MLIPVNHDQQVQNTFRPALSLCLYHHLKPVQICSFESHISLLLNKCSGANYSEVKVRLLMAQVCNSGHFVLQTTSSKKIGMLVLHQLLCFGWYFFSSLFKSHFMEQQSK